MNAPTTAPMQVEEKWPPVFGAPWVVVLVVIEGPDTGSVHRLMLRESKLGREDDCDIAIGDAQVSSEHALLRSEGGVTTCTDLDSRNGTWLNGRRLEPGSARRLHHLDELRVGETRMFVLSGKYRAVDGR